MNWRLVNSCMLTLCVISWQSSTLAEYDTTTDETNKQTTQNSLISFATDLFKPVPAQPYWYVQTSVYTKHFNPNPKHNNNQDLIGLERHTANSYLLGGATFRHSFGQRSYYGYTGKRFDFAGTPFYGKVTAGLLYGYKGEYRDKIPFNRFEIAPAVIPSFGVKYRRLGAEILLLGTAATMINVGIEL